MLATYRTQPKRRCRVLKVIANKVFPARVYTTLAKSTIPLRREIRHVRYRFGRLARGIKYYRRTNKKYKQQSSDIRYANAIFANKVAADKRLNESQIFYESYKGREFSGNPYALFCYLHASTRYNHLRHVIVVPVGDLKTRHRFQDDERVVIVEPDSKEYIYYHQTSKYIFNDTSIRDYITKVQGQVYIHSWHSTLLKRLARDTGRPWEAARVGRTLLNTDVLLSPNRYTTDHLLKSHAVDQFFEGRIAEFGYPRIDRTIDPPKDLREDLGVGRDEFLVLYAPTWRGQYKPEDNVKEMVRLYQELQTLLPDGYRLLLKLHTMTYRYIDDEHKKMLVPSGVDVNELLGVVDMLVTDYSGIFFDFLVTGRPIAFLTLDIEEYSQSNGFYLDINELPGPRFQTIEALARAITDRQSWIDSYSDRYDSFRSEYVAEDDGHVCERAAALIFENRFDKRVRLIRSDVPSIVLYAGKMNTNGVTVAFRALLSRLAEMNIRVLVVIPDMNANQEVQAALPDSINLAYVVSVDGLTFREYRQMSALRNYGATRERDIPSCVLERIARGWIGDFHFDLSVNFHGYFPTAVALFGVGVQADKRLCFLHNDLVKDMAIKHPQLRAVFSLYNSYDSLACVSEQSRRDNARDIDRFVSQHYGINVNRPFVTVHNTIDPNLIRLRSVSELRKVEIDEARYVVSAEDGQLTGFRVDNTEGLQFLAIGRLSKEKNHRRLLRAMSLHLSSYPDSSLVVVGSGPLFDNLAGFSKQLGIADRVSLAGNLPNPLPLLRTADCFVSSSDIEGQPITVLEALTLGCPIIATRIGGHIDLLSDSDGLVDPNAVALAHAMDRFAAGEISGVVDFDADQFVDQALAEFCEQAGLDAPEVTSSV